MHNANGTCTVTWLYTVYESETTAVYVQGVTSTALLPMCTTVNTQWHVCQDQHLAK